MSKPNYQLQDAMLFMVVAYAIATYFTTKAKLDLSDQTSLAVMNTTVNNQTLPICLQCQNTSFIMSATIAIYARLLSLPVAALIGAGLGKLWGHIKDSRNTLKPLLIPEQTNIQPILLNQPINEASPLLSHRINK